MRQDPHNIVVHSLEEKKQHKKPTGTTNKENYLKKIAGIKMKTVIIDSRTQVIVPETTKTEDVIKKIWKTK